VFKSQQGAAPSFCVCLKILAKRRIQRHRASNCIVAKNTTSYSLLPVTFGVNARLVANSRRLLATCRVFIHVVILQGVFYRRHSRCRTLKHNSRRRCLFRIVSVPKITNKFTKVRCSCKITLFMSQRQSELRIQGQ